MPIANLNIRALWVRPGEADHNAHAYNVVTFIEAAGEELNMAITRVQIYDIFGTGNSAKIDEVLSELPSNMRIRPNVFTMGVVRRLAEMGFIVYPNWISQNKATYRATLDTGRYTVSQTGILSRSEKNTGIALQAYCIKYGYTQCDPWKVSDPRCKSGQILVVGYVQQESGNMRVITTDGFREMSQDGALL